MFLKKSSTKFGITSLVSGKCCAKKSTNCSFVFNDSKEFSPSWGINKVHVKLPSKLANAINMKFPLGQICKDFSSNLCEPSELAGIFNSLYPIFKNSCE